MPSSSRFAVAIHILVDLAFCESSEVKTSHAMAQRVNTHPVVIRRLFCQLHAAGLIQTKPGKQGGAKLAKPPQRISLWEIYEAIGESNLFSYNPNSPDPHCAISCGMQHLLEPVFARAQRALKGELRRQKLNQLVRHCQKSLEIHSKST